MSAALAFERRRIAKVLSFQMSVASTAGLIENSFGIDYSDHRDNEERLKEKSALKIQKAFRAQRFRMAEQPGF